MSTDANHLNDALVGKTRAARAPGGKEQSSSGEGRESAASFSTPDATRSSLFPPGGGTGERVAPEIGSHPVDRVPDLENGSGTGTAIAPPYPARSIPLPFSINRSEQLPTSSAFVRSTPQASSSWSAQPVGEIVLGLQAGTLERPRPSVGALADGSFWLYAGAVNGLAGESGCGKTWTALAAVAAELIIGHSVIYVDFEDSVLGIVSRLLDMGVAPELIADPMMFAYVRPEVAFRDDERTAFWELIARTHPMLVVIDSTGESMALEGTDPNSDDGVAVWFRRVATAISDYGPAVLLLDHLPKSDNAAKSPIGSQRKRAAISGVQMIQTVRPGMSFAKGRAGEARLTCTKDRHGNFVTGEVALQLTVNPEAARGETGLEVRLSAVGDDEWAPTRHMLEISEFLEAAGVAKSTGAIKQGVKGKAETLVAALGVLVASGYVTAAAAPRNSTEYTHVAPFRLGDPYSVPDDAAGGAAGCVHPWHTDKCNLDWCHSSHHGKCNELVEQGYVLDVDGDIITEPAEIAARREAQLRDVLARNAAAVNTSPWDDSHEITPPNE